MRRARVPNRVRTGGAALLALLLSGCALAPPGPETPLLRNPTVPLGGTSRFVAADFAGNWVTSHCLGLCDRQVSYASLGDGRVIRNAGGASQALEITAPGILRAAEGGDRLVVMWIDSGFRTAVMGDAEGRWASVMHRPGQASADRTRAAIELLDFNGWDTGKLRKIAE